MDLPGNLASGYQAWLNFGSILAQKVANGEVPCVPYLSIRDSQTMGQTIHWLVIDQREVTIY
jgi:hypothetical protein